MSCDCRLALALAVGAAVDENRLEMHGNQRMVELPEARKGSERWATAAVGLLFVGVALAIAYWAAAEYTFGAIAAAVLVGGLGVDALVSAVRGRRSILSRIGPLP